jgi:hypothetical protein
MIKSQLIRVSIRRVCFTISLVNSLEAFTEVRINIV